MRKKIISLCLSVIMVLSLTTPVFAEDTDVDVQNNNDNIEEIVESETEQNPDQNMTEKSETNSDEPSNDDDDDEQTAVNTLSAETAFAVYSEDDNSLTFYADSVIPEDGTVYNGKNATNVYTGFEETLATKSSGVKWGKVKSDITSVVFDESFSCIQPTSPQYWFADCENLVNVDFTGLDASKMKNMGYMFQNCSSLVSLDLSGINTESATSFYSFVENCTSLTHINLDGFDTESATNFHTMFAGCENLTEIDVSGFDTSKATMMYGMFKGCTALQYLDFSNWNTSNIPSSKYDTSFNYFATGCPSIVHLLIGNDFDLFAKATQAQVDAQTWYDSNNECVSDDYLIGYSGTGDVFTEAQEPHVHTVVVDEAIEPTCRNMGLTEGSHCSECGTVIVAQEKIPATGHAYVATVEKEATCTEDGVMRYRCEYGDASYTEPINATGHTVVTDKAVSATCTKTGLTEGSHCSSCGEVFTKQSTTAKLGHNYKSSVSGFVKTYKCSRCSDSYTEKLYPSLKSVTANASSITVSWKSLDNAKGYAVFRKSGKNGSWKRIATTTSTSYKDTASLSNGTTYYYTVRAYKGSQSTALKNTYSDSYWSTYNSDGISFTYTKTPSISKITNTESGIKASWSKVSGAKGYAVYRKTKNGSWKRLGTTTSTSYTDKTAKSGTTYYYTVRAYRGSKTDALNNTYNAKYWSGYKSFGSKARFMSTPGSLKVTTNKKSKRVVKWSGVKNASGYAVFRKQGKNGSWKLIGTTTKKSYTDKTRLKKGKTYYYTVRAYNGKAKTAKKNKWASYYWSSYKTSGVSFKAK